MHSRRYTQLASLLVGLALVGGCSGASSSASPSAAASIAPSAAPAASTAPSAPAAALPTTIDFANFSANGALFLGLQNGIKTAASKVNIALHVYNNNNNGATTLSNANLMVLDHPGAILEYNPISDAGTRLGQIFNQAKIPCVAVNIPFPGCAWFNQSDSVLANQLAGVLAKLIQAKGWKGSDITAVLLENPSAGPAVNVAVWDDYSALADAVPGMTKIAATKITAQTTTIGTTGLQVNAGNTLETAYTAMQQALQTIPASRHIVLFSIDDDLTVGAYRALQGANRATDAMLTGFGGDAQALQAIRTNPAWVGEEDSFFASWGEYLIALAASVAEGATAPSLTLSPETIITKSNIDTFYAAGSTTPKMLPGLPSQDQFLLNTGVLQQFGNIVGIK